MGRKRPRSPHPGPTTCAALVWRPAERGDRTATLRSQAEGNALQTRRLLSRGTIFIPRPEVGGDKRGQGESARLALAPALGYASAPMKLYRAFATVGGLTMVSATGSYMLG
jgi:hypothetical protein